LSKRFIASSKECVAILQRQNCIVQRLFNATMFELADFLGSTYRGLKNGQPKMIISRIERDASILSDFSTSCNLPQHKWIIEALLPTKIAPHQQRPRFPQHEYAEPIVTATMRRSYRGPTPSRRNSNL